MGIILDIVIIAILVLNIILGYRKGLIKVAFNLCAFIVAVIITWILYAPVTNLIINNTQIDENIKNTIIEKGVIKSEQKEETDENSVNGYIKKYVTTPATDKANEAVETIATEVSQKVVAIFVIIGLFILVRIGLLLLRFLSDIIAELPIIKQFNEVGGIIYGIIVGLFVIYIFLAILFFVMSINDSGLVANIINTSLISKYLYTNNIILNIIF